MSKLYVVRSRKGVDIEALVLAPNDVDINDFIGEVIDRAMKDYDVCFAVDDSVLKPIPCHVIAEDSLILKRVESPEGPYYVVFDKDAVVAERGRSVAKLLDGIKDADVTVIDLTSSPH